MPKGIPGLHTPVSSVHSELECLSFSSFVLFHSKTRNKNKPCAFSLGPQNLSPPVWHPDFSQLPNPQWVLYPFTTINMHRIFWREGTTSSPLYTIFPKGNQHIPKRKNKTANKTHPKAILPKNLQPNLNHKSSNDNVQHSDTCRTASHNFEIVTSHGIFKYSGFFMKQLVENSI